MGASSSWRWGTFWVIPFDDCAANSINKAENSSKTAEHQFMV